MVPTGPRGAWSKGVAGDRCTDAAGTREGAPQAKPAQRSEEDGGRDHRLSLTIKRGQDAGPRPRLMEQRPHTGHMVPKTIKTGPTGLLPDRSGPVLMAVSAVRYHML